MTNLNNDTERKAFIKAFWEAYEPLLVKHRLAKRRQRTKVSSEEVPSKHLLGRKERYVLTNGSSSITFSIDVQPFLWSDATLQVITELEETKRLAFPSKHLKPIKHVKVWKPGWSPITFLQNTEPVLRYIQAVEMTPLDLSLFDTVQVALDNLLGGKP